MISAKVIADSVSSEGVRITTMVLEYPRAIHGELMTHRVFSRNAASSRAIPIEEMIRRVQDGGWIPEFWGKKKAGMQDGGNWSAPLQVPVPCVKDIYDGLTTCYDEMTPDEAWEYAKSLMIPIVEAYDKAGYHKQIPNRLLEAFQYQQTIVTGTEWDGFFKLRISGAAEPHFNKLATITKEVRDASIPKILGANDWHLPFTEDIDIKQFGLRLIELGLIPGLDDTYESELVKDLSLGSFYQVWIAPLLMQVSVARCARVSYGLNERLTTRDIADDLKLYEQLATDKHMSPFEHVAAPMMHATHNDFLNDNNHYGWYWQEGVTHMGRKGELWSGNFRGWIQYRALVEQS